MAASVQKPRCLKSGDTIAVISPAAPSPPEKLQVGKLYLEGLGYKVKLMPHAADKKAYLAGADEERASDLMAAFQDPEVNAILCARGGYGCSRLLPLLDFNVIAQNPKLFMGFSDITVLLNAFYDHCGLVGFYSPMLTSNLIEPEQGFTEKVWLKCVTESALNAPFGIPNQDTYHCLWPGEVEGPIRGGNYTLLASLCGTPWQPNFEGCIVFLEDWKERFYTLDRQWVQMCQAGLFNGVKGLIFCDFSQLEQEHDLNLPDFFKELTEGLQIPVGFGLTVGHGEQTATIPMGVQASLSTLRGDLTILDAPVLN